MASSNPFNLNETKIQVQDEQHHVAIRLNFRSVCLGWLSGDEDDDKDDGITFEKG